MTRLAALLVVLSAATVAQAQYDATVQVVLDASRGMATQVDGETRFARSLAVVRSTLEKASPPAGVELSLRIAGAPERGSDACSATRTVVPGGITPGPVLDTLQLRPGGARPLAAAIEGAAGEIMRTSARGLVVVTSGGDECRRDLCEEVRELRRTQGLGQVEVVLVGGSSTKELACLGRVRTATTKAQIAAALEAALDALFNPVEVTVQAVEAKKAVPADVELYAPGDSEPTARGQSGAPLAVPGGRYNVKVLVADDGREGWRRDVELAAGSKLTVKVAVSAEPGQLTVKVRLNGKPAPQGTRLFVHRPGETSDELASGWPDEPLRIVPGLYDVRAQIPGGAFGFIDVWRPDVKVEPGGKLAFALDAVQKQGTLLARVKSSGVLVEEAGITLMPNKARDGAGAELQPGQPTTVPAGTWTLAARAETLLGFVESFKDDVVVAPGEKRELDLDVGQTGSITVEVIGLSEDENISVGIVKPGQMDPAAWTTAFAPLRLPAGKYHLVLEWGRPLPRVWWHRDVVVPAGGHRVVLVPKPK